MSQSGSGDALSGQARPGQLPPKEHKVPYVRDLFGRIAGRYDGMNSIMTLGRDRAWRRYAVEQAIASPAPRAQSGEKQVGRVLDVATGTGELALEVLRQRPTLEVVGIDFVPQMLSLAQMKAAKSRHKVSEGGDRGRLRLVSGDALRLPFAESVFDSVVTGFALRNVADIPAAFAEMARVTRPGGRLACLEIAKPGLPLLRWLFSLYFYRLIPLLGACIARERSAYTYLPHSLTAFLTPDQICTVMQETGWSEVRYRRLMLGGVAIHVGIRK